MIMRMDATCLVIMGAALFKDGILGIEDTETQEIRQYPRFKMKFSWEKVSRLDEYSMRGTTYYDPQRMVYRFDASDSANRLFFWPQRGWVIYHFHKTVEEELVRGCYRMMIPKTGVLPSPILSTNDRNFRTYRKEGQVNYRGKQVTRYVKNQRDGSTISQNLTLYEQHEIFIANVFPVRLEFKKWLTSGLPDYEKYRLEKHEVTDYYGFSYNFDDDILAIPVNETCVDVTYNKPLRDSIKGYADVVQVPDELKRNLEAGSDHSNVRSMKYGSGSSRDYDKVVFPESQPNDVKYQNLPLSWDWRNYGAVTSVKNQRECGGCWAFGAVAALESAHFLKYNQSVVLSEQFLIDCSWYEQNEGCAQGSVENAFQWIKKNGGVPLAHHYGPYKNMNGKCKTRKFRADTYIKTRTKTHNKLYAGIRALKHITSDDTNALKYDLVNYGPVVVHIDATPMLSYTNGIITKCVVESLYHYVLVVGYGETKDREPYWIVKNSWGNSWGMDGYGLLSAKPGENCLGILTSPIIPVLE